MTTKHTHQVVFGRKVEGCPRCAELSSGAPAVKWSGAIRSEQRVRHLQDIASHFSSHRHITGQCGPVCTFGEW